MKVFIATPSMGGLMKSAFVNSLIGIVNDFMKEGIPFEFCNLDGSSIVLARNFLTNAFLQSKESTHILFLDSDMVIPKGQVLRMIQSDLPVIGAIYTEKSLNFDFYSQALRETDDDEAALALSTKFNVGIEVENGTVKMENGLVPVNRLGFGCMLIRRDALEHMISHGVVAKCNPQKFRSYGLTDPIYDFFSETWTEDDELLSEDYSFCERYLDIEGNSIWAVADQNTGHIGDFVYGATYAHRLKTGIL